MPPRPCPIPGRGRGSRSDRGGTAAVVVNYESGPALARCVEDLRARGTRRIGRGRQRFPRRVRRRSSGAVPRRRRRRSPGANLGYGAAANRGVAATTAPYVLVCNPDLEVRPGAVGRAGRGAGADAGLRAGRTADPRPGGRALPLGPPVPVAWSMPPATPLFGLFVPDNRFTRAYQQAELDGRAWTLRASTGCPGPAFWSGGPPSRRWADSTSRTSCTPRTWTCAGAWPGRMGGRLRPGGRGDPSPGRLDRAPSLPDDRRAPPLAAPVRRPVVGRVAAGCCCRWWPSGSGSGPAWPVPGPGAPGRRPPRRSALTRRL